MHFNNPKSCDHVNHVVFVIKQHVLGVKVRSLGAPSLVESDGTGQPSLFARVKRM